MTASDIPHVANYLLEKHGLVRHGWKFEWDRAKCRAGCCKYKHKAITLSRHYVELNSTSNPDDIIDTILHEIAHALTKGHGHDEVWRAKAEEIGATPKRCCNADIVVMPRGEYVAKCDSCGKEFRRHKSVTHHYCLTCGPERGRLMFINEVAMIYQRKIEEQSSEPRPIKLRD